LGDLQGWMWGRSGKRGGTLVEAAAPCQRRVLQANITFG